MPGQRSSLVCCWGPAAFHLPGWICYESFGGGKVCTFFKFCLCGKTGWIFKPDTIIINHQLEFSGTRVEYLDHEKRAYKHEIISHIRKKPQITPHYGASRETRCLKVVWVFFNLHTLFMRKAKALARPCVHAGSSEPSPHADVIRTMIKSCADQFLVIILIALLPYIYLIATTLLPPIQTYEP